MWVITLSDIDHERLLLVKIWDSECKENLNRNEIYTYAITETENAGLLK